MGTLRYGFIPADMEKRRGYIRERMRLLRKTADLTALLQNLFLQMQTRFQTMSESIITMIEEMESRIDELERSIGELVKDSSHADAMLTRPSNSSFKEVQGGSTKEAR